MEKIDSKNALVVFENKNIRRTWFNDEWYYSLVDIIEALTESVNPTDYLKKLRKRDEELGLYLGTNCPHVEMLTELGKKRLILAGNTKNIFRIIQSIPSKKAEPFKQWLAKLGQERIDEIENPELAQDRIKEYYELKGYPKDWIDKRLRGISIRQDLTEEWKDRGIKEQRDFSILTNEISKATFGKTVKEYKELKSLHKKNQNLRDHMTDWELILTMVGEKATTDITISKDSQGFTECKDSANDGGMIAKNTRKEIEQKTGRSIMSDENYLHLTEKDNKLIKNKKDK
ncbi:MAG: Bro-N domain-containing protein [Candidatus Aenigmarchaeota archaeon]|nr:Bro-N domain-containing protein [Candidatus Aenigmarchaeota archaeon]